MKGRTLRWIVPVLAAVGLAYAVWYTTVLGVREPARPNPLAMPAESPYPATVSGSGLIEASSRNIDVGSFSSGIVAAVSVTEGQWVEAGDPLFVLDQRLAQAELATARRDVAAAEARVVQAQAELADQLDQLRRVQGLRPGVSVSEDRLARVQFAYRTAEAKVAAARADADVARAQAESADVTLDRLTVHAPITGRVLKVNARVGEFVMAGATIEPLVLLGDDRPMHVRAQIDENDVWRLRPDAPAEAVVRGNPDLRFPLSFVRIEPYVLPKRSLTGDRAERVDTRVLEVVYSLNPDGKPVYIGQQVDVFIEAK
jgi:HlyD family secretion protein